MDTPKTKSRQFANLTQLTATYNIFITTNKDIANLFSESQAKRGSTFSEFYGSPVMQNALGVFMSTADLNILEFSHAYNFGHGKNVDNSIKLKTFEPGMEILKKFFFMFMQEQMSAIKLRKHFLSKEGGPLGPDSLAHRLRRHKAGDLSNKAPTDPEDIAALDAGIAAASKDALVYLQKNSIGQQVYIAYGIGNDLKDWAGPFQATLGKIIYDNNGMQETITYEMWTDHVARQFENTTILEEDKGFKPVDFIRPTIPILGFDYINDHGAYSVREGRKHGVGRFPESFTSSIHDTVVKLISYYLHSIGIKNHLIVLPNLDLLLAKAVAEAVTLEDWHKIFGLEDYGLLEDVVMQEHHSEGLDAYGTFTNALSEDYYAKYSLNVAKDLTEKIRSLFVNIMSIGEIEPTTGVEALNFFSTKEARTLNLAQRIDVLLRVFARIGMKVNKSEVASSDNADSALVNFVEQDRRGYTKEYLAQTDPGETQSRLYTKADEYEAQGLLGYPYLKWMKSKDPFSPDSPPLLADAIFNLELPFQHLPSGELANQDGAYYMAPIMDITNSILQSGGNAAYTPTYFWENDVKIVNKLKEKFGSGTFGGYVKQIEENKKQTGGVALTGGAAGEPIRGSIVKDFPPPPAFDDNYFIFGDANLIKLFLYGEYTTIATNNKLSRLESTRAWEGIPFEFNTYISRGQFFFMDPFWNRLKADLQLCTQDDTEFSKTGSYENTSEEEKGFEKVYMSNLYKSYFYEMRSLLKGKNAVMGHFNEYDLNTDASKRFDFAKKLPDEFSDLFQSTDPATRRALTDLYDLGPIIFVANDKNANVLSYNFDNDQFLFSQFFGTLQEVYYNTHLRYSNTLAYPLRGEASTDIERSKLYSMLDNLGRRSGSYGKIFKEVFKDLDLGVDKGRLATDMADIMIMESTGNTRYTPVGRKSATLSMLQLFLSLFKHQYRGSITTLPMFNVANMGVLNRPGLVLFRSTGRVNTFSESPTTTMDFFTGLYKVLGFRHSISNTDAKSEFFVYKDIEGMLG